MPCQVAILVTVEGLVFLPLIVITTSLFVVEHDMDVAWRAHRGVELRVVDQALVLQAINRLCRSLSLVSFLTADGSRASRWTSFVRAPPTTVGPHQPSRGEQEQMNRRFSQYGPKATALALVVAASLAGGVLAGCGSDSSNIASTVEKQIEKGNETAEKILNDTTKQVQAELKKSNAEAGVASKQAEEATEQTEEAIQEANVKAKKGLQKGQEMSEEITEEVNKQIEEATP
jgi:hypothetical protein